MRAPYPLRDTDWDEKTVAIIQATGFYLYWFGLVELALTLLLGKVLGFDKEYERLDLLVGSMDTYAKVARLRTACERYKKPIGQHFGRALEVFVTDERKLRNHMAHAWPVLDDKATIHFSSLGAMPEGIFGPAPTRPLRLAPSNYRLVDIYARALWLKLFYRHLIGLARLSDSLLEYEVDESLMDQRPGHQAKVDLAPRTKIDKRAQKAHRKTLRKRPSEEGQA